MLRAREHEKLASMFTDIHASGQRMLALVNDPLDAPRSRARWAPSTRAHRPDCALVLVRTRSTCCWYRPPAAPGAQTLRAAAGGQGRPDALPAGGATCSPTRSVLAHGHRSGRADHAGRRDPHRRGRPGPGIPAGRRARLRGLRAIQPHQGRLGRHRPRASPSAARSSRRMAAASTPRTGPRAARSSSSTLPARHDRDRAQCRCDVAPLYCPSALICSGLRALYKSS